MKLVVLRVGNIDHALHGPGAVTGEARTVARRLYGKRVISRRVLEHAGTVLARNGCLAWRGIGDAIREGDAIDLFSHLAVAKARNRIASHGEQEHRERGEQRRTP